ncbi:MAG: substrate-binding domain-containing protein [Actinomycetia bacterium]|nr:substrate-binding domain-containing protein [Actinomycetes bacterium]
MKLRLVQLACAAVLVAATGSLAAPPRVQADTYQRISGSGSSWAANAIDAMRVNVKQFGITVDFNPNGSTAGRKDYLNGVVDFAASDIPFQFNPEDGSAPENPAAGSYAYIPVTAGGTAFMYNLKINGKRVTNLRLSGENVAKIFTGAITMWNDPAIVADNPGLTLPARTVVPVVRSDGSGSSAQFTAWMIKTHEPVWNNFCQRSGRAPACGFTSFYPTVQGMIAQQGDLGVAGYVSQNFAEGAIGYVNYSYALGSQFPVVKLLNAAGYYTEPTPEKVAVSLLKAQINTDASNPSLYLTQNLDGVYADTDPRNYQLSSYSYLIVPTIVQGQFNLEKGKTLGAFAYYAMCEAQQQSASLGYSPMPVNLVEASFDQIRKIPGVVVENVNIAQCQNPTFSADGTNTLAQNAAAPKSCDQQGPTQCPDGTAGMANVPTAINPSAQAPTATVPASGGATPTTVASGGATKTTTAPGAGGATGTTVVDPNNPNGVTDPNVTLPDGSPVVIEGVGTVTCIDPSACGATSPDGVATPQGALTAAPAVATMIADSSSTGTLGLELLVVFLTLGMVLGPAIAWRYFTERRS